jgi:hypothetical protein
LEKEIKKRYLQDCVVTLICVVVLWLIQIYVVGVVAGIVTDPAAKSVISFAGIAAAVIATTAAAAVIFHLKKNKIKIYSKELETNASHPEQE